MNIHISHSPSKGLALDKRMRVQKLADVVDSLLNGTGTVFDMACGHGELMCELAGRGYEVSGMDIDEECIRLSQQYGKTELGSYRDLANASPAQYDIVVSSHSLEHLRAPADEFVELVRVSKKYVLIAVPNPMSLENTLASIFRKILPVISGHIALWDHRHLNNLAVSHLGISPILWTGDFVRFIPRRLSIRKVLHKVGFVRFLEARVLMAIFPFFANSIIMVGEKKSL